MALEVEMYLPSANDSLIQPWLDRLAELGMRCEFHPDFSFSSQNGHLPIRLRNLKPTRDEFKDRDFLSGFEFYLAKFNISEMLFKKPVKPSGLGRLFGKKQAAAPHRVSGEVDAILEKCNWHLTFRFSPADVFELRLADISSIVISELTNGIRYLPSDGEWMVNQNFAPVALASIEDFERSLEVGGYQSHLFEGWR